MAVIDKEFKELCQKILSDGKEYENKNRGVKRLQIPSYTFRHSFSDGFPAISLKDLYWRGIVGELIWFLRGDNNVKYLNDNGIKIWNKDAYNWYKKHFIPTKDMRNGSVDELMNFEEFSKIGEGSVGQNYSVQWRNFNGKTDQIKDLINGMKKDIMSSRLKVNAWNPSEIFQTALPPCHSEFQVIGVPISDDKFGFELHWNQRSVDTFLGLPFNIASYGLLAKILEKITGFEAIGIEGTLKCVHFYDNQYLPTDHNDLSVVDVLMSRDENKYMNCDLLINPIFDEKGNGYDIWEIEGIDELFNALEIDMFTLVGYEAYDKISVEMLAPKEL